MKLVFWILGGYVIYYLCLFIWDAIKNGVGESDEEESQIIEVSENAQFGMTMYGNISWKN